MLLGPSVTPTAATEPEHPLARRVWDVDAQQFISPQTLMGRLASHRYVLLGEKHDNTEHHRFQARVLRALARQRRPAVAVELFDAGDEALLRDAQEAGAGTASELARRLEWPARDWPAFAVYRPMLAAALEQQLTVTHGNLARERIRAIGRQGLDALSPEQRATLALDRPIAESVRRSMAREIDEAHCGYAPAPMVQALVTVQWARDAYMARRLIETDRGAGTVLIAGAGHVRRDRGVPAHLRVQSPGAEAVTVAAIETRADAQRVEDYAAEFEDERLPYDYVWFSPPRERDDPCVRFRRQLEKLGEDAPGE